MKYNIFSDLNQNTHYVFFTDCTRDDCGFGGKQRRRNNLVFRMSSDRLG
jgi:hypothetical protein